jgi:hypothetical protein
LFFNLCPEGALYEGSRGEGPLRGQGIKKQKLLPFQARGGRGGERKRNSIQVYRFSPPLFACKGSIFVFAFAPATGYFFFTPACERIVLIFIIIIKIIIKTRHEQRFKKKNNKEEAF